MMRWPGKSFRAACLCAVGTACSTAYSGEEPSIDASSLDAAPTTSPSDAAIAAEAALTSDAANSDAGADGGGAKVVAAYTFETSCAPWAPNANTTTGIVAGGVTGNACRVCSTATAGSRVSVSIAGVGPGTYRAAARIKSVDYSGAVQLEVRFQGDGGTVIGPNTTAQASKDQWLSLAVDAPSSNAPMSVLIVITAYSGPGCVLLDDASLAIDSP